MDQQFLQNYDATELKTASEFLSNWLPFLSNGLCNSCSNLLSNRIRSMHTFTVKETSFLVGTTPVIINQNKLKDVGSSRSNDDNGDDTHSLGSWKDESEGFSCEHAVEEKLPSVSESVTTQTKKSWADMTLEDELAESEDGTLLDEEPKPKVVLSREQRECIRFRSVGRKKDFAHLERVHRKIVNIVDGLELHTGVFSAAEQKRIVDYVEQLQEMGRKGQLKDRTYSAPAKWMRGKGRVTLQFGCCYNYATDKKGNPPGIMKNELVDPLPHLFKVMIKRLVRWHVLPPSSVPDSCIVNIYDEGDCIPPHIDNHDFLRPFCTVSFLSECEIVFGSNLKIMGPGEFAGSFAIPLPLGSVLVLNGNGADVAKHCVPAVPNKRISITFRKMDESKWPEGYVPEPDLQGIQPLLDEADIQKKDNNYSGANSNDSSGARRSSPRTPNSVGRGDRSKEFIPRQHSDNRYSDNPYSSAGQYSDNRYSDNRYSSSGQHSDNRNSDNRYSSSGQHSDNRYSSEGRGRRQVSINSNGRFQVNLQN